MLGNASVGLAAGAECMSQAPHVLRGSRWGMQLGVDAPLVDSLWEGLTDRGAGCPMAITAENLAEQYGISKDECDAYAFRSQQAWKEAHEAGRFSAEMAPMEIKGKRGKVSVLEHDEHARPDASLEAISKLPALFKKDGVVSAGNVGHQRRRWRARRRQRRGCHKAWPHAAGTPGRFCVPALTRLSWASASASNSWHPGAQQHGNRRHRSR